MTNSINFNDQVIILAQDILQNFDHSKVNDELDIPKFSEKVRDLATRLFQDPEFQTLATQLQSAERKLPNDSRMQRLWRIEGSSDIENLCRQVVTLKLHSQTKEAIANFERFLEIRSTGKGSGTPLNATIANDSLGAGGLEKRETEAKRLIQDLKKNYSGNLLKLPTSLLKRQAVFEEYFYEGVPQPFYIIKPLIEEAGFPEAANHLRLTLYSPQDKSQAGQLDALFLKHQVNFDKMGEHEPFILEILRGILQPNLGHFPSSLIPHIDVFEAIFARGLDMNCKSKSQMIKSSGGFGFTTIIGSESGGCSLLQSLSALSNPSAALMAVDYGASIDSMVTKEEQHQIQKALKQDPNPSIQGIDTFKIELVKQLNRGIYRQAYEAVQGASGGVAASGAAAGGMEAAASAAAAAAATRPAEEAEAQNDPQRRLAIALKCRELRAMLTAGSQERHYDARSGVLNAMMEMSIRAMDAAGTDKRREEIGVSFMQILRAALTQGIGHLADVRKGSALPAGDSAGSLYAGSARASVSIDSARADGARADGASAASAAAAGAAAAGSENSANSGVASAKRKPVESPEGEPNAKNHRTE